MKSDHPWDAITYLELFYRNKSCMLLVLREQATQTLETIHSCMLEAPSAEVEGMDLE